MDRQTWLAEQRLKAEQRFDRLDSPTYDEDDGPHPDAHRDLEGPLLAGECDLSVDCRAERRRCVRKGDDERVAFGAALRAAGGGDGGSDDLVMPIEYPGKGGRSELLDEPCRALDIGEKGT